VGRVWKKQIKNIGMTDKEEFPIVKLSSKQYSLYFCEHLKPFSGWLFLENA
jgi:hypothetical protein